VQNKHETSKIMDMFAMYVSQKILALRGRLQPLTMT
jgi:hypothetical protein